MTLIAHGILKLDEVIKKHRLKAKTGENADWVEWGTGHDRELKKIKKAERRLKKLDDVEDFIAGKLNLINLILNDGKPMRRGTHPLALEAMLVANVAGLAASPIVGLAVGGVALGKKIGDLADKAKYKREQKQYESKLKADEKAERQEIDLALELIEKAGSVHYRTADDRDANAMTAGLINQSGMVANLYSKDEKNGDYVVFVFVEAEKDKINIFFKNPETGNYEQIANVNSLNGINKIIKALRKRAGRLTNAKADKRDKMFINAQIETIKEAKR